MKYLLIILGMLLGTLPITFVHADDVEAMAVQVTHAYVNSMPPVVKVTAGFFELRNSGSATITLTGISSPQAEKVELHRSASVDGRMTMRQLISLDIAPGEKIKLEPGGMHLMLWGLDRSLRPGNFVRLTLHFSNGQRKIFPAELRDVRDESSRHHGH